jgi:hypothetical protein
MKTGLLILSLIFSSVMMAQPVHLTVPAVDPSNNAVTIGMAYFTWGQFTGNDGVTVQAGQLTRPITNGTIDVTLVASDNAGYVYTLLLMHGSAADTFAWRVPAAGATTMAELNQPPSTNGDSTGVHTNQANTYTAGKKQTFSSSATTAGEGFGGVSADPSAVVAGDRWFRTDLHHMRIYDGTTGQTVMYQSDTLPWNQLANPTAATSLLFAANPFNVTFGNATGSGNMMTVTDTASNSGTGYVFTAGTGSASAAKPFQVLSNGANIIDTDALGGLTLGSSDFAVPVIIRNTIKAGLNVGAGNAFWFYNNNLLMQSNTAIGDSGNAYEFSDNSGSTLRQVQVSSLWIGATKTGGRVGGFTPSGTGTVAGLQTATSEKTADYTAGSDDLSVLCDATAGAVTITLPAAPKTGEWKALKKVDSSAHACTYSGNGKNIEGAATLVYSTQYQHAMAQYDGNQWWLY